jgi:hypothetical protein
MDACCGRRTFRAICHARCPPPPGCMPPLHLQKPNDEDNSTLTAKKKGPSRAAVVLDRLPIFISRSRLMLTSEDSISTGMGESQKTKRRKLVSGTFVFCSHRLMEPSRRFQIGVPSPLILNQTPSFSTLDLSEQAS